MMKTKLCLFLFVVCGLRAQIPVTDVANLVNNQVSQAATIAKWVESIAQLRQQIQQLDQQINIQTDLRQWAGDPKVAGTKLLLGSLGAQDLVKYYGRAKDVIRSVTNSLDSLKSTGSGNYRAIVSIDINGNQVIRDALAYRRFSILDATQANTDQVTADITTRTQDIQTEIAATLDDIKGASTDAETQKLSSKLAALNGQLGQLEVARKKEVDAVVLQKIANDARAEEERQAAAELATKDDFLANQRVSTYMKSIKLRQK